MIFDCPFSTQVVIPSAAQAESRDDKVVCNLIRFTDLSYIKQVPRAAAPVNIGMLIDFPGTFSPFRVYGNGFVLGGSVLLDVLEQKIQTLMG